MSALIALVFLLIVDAFDFAAVLLIHAACACLTASTRVALFGARVVSEDSCHR